MALVLSFKHQLMFYWYNGDNEANSVQTFMLKPGRIISYIISCPVARHGTLILFSLMAFSCMTSATATPLSPPVSGLISNSYTEGQDFSKETCPRLESLVQDSQMKWGAPGGWKSSDPSFVRSLTQFIGAQWSGVNVGEVLCLYIKSGRSDFPVTLRKQIIVLSPTGGGWSADKGGYKDCTSTDIRECAFEIPQNTKTRRSIYEELDFYKGQPVHN
jgi:hypothetical protein